MSGIKVLAPIPPQHLDTISTEALQFVAVLQRAFNSRRKELLAARVKRQTAIEKGQWI